MSAGPWTCYHCGLTFHEASAAAEHFGRREDGDPPTCISTKHPLVARLRAHNGELRRWLSWALDILDMYDERLVQLGEPPQLVNSQVHLDAKRRARLALE